jgi:predicted phage terminase large subunit-like protein
VVTNTYSTDPLSRLRYINESIWKEDAEGSLFSYIKLMWPIVEPARQFIAGWHIEAMCEHLEAVTNGQITRLLINVPPGTSKSLTTNVFWPSWEWGPQDMPSTRYVSFAYSDTLTVRDNGRFAMIVESPLYQRLWGDRFDKDPRQWGKEKLQNDKTGFKFATSVGGVGTGERGDRVIIDDPHNVTEGESEKIRLSTGVWFQESIPTRMNEPTKSAIVIIMQRVHEDDVSGIAIAKQLGYEHLMLPMRYDYKRHCTTVIGFEDPRRYDDEGDELTEEVCDGSLLDPIRFPLKTLNTLERTLREYATAAQHQQLPSPRGGGLIKNAWWKLYPEEGEGFDERGKPLKQIDFPMMEFILASLDTAYTTKEENDWSALTIWGVWRDNSNISRLMLMHAWQVKLGFRNLVDKVIDTCRKRNVDSLLIEAKANGLPVAQEMARLCNIGEFSVLPVNPKHDKVARVYACQSFFEDGVIFAPDRDWSRMVIDECAKFPKGAHDDLVDTVTQAIVYMRRAGILMHPAESAEANAAENLYESAPEELYDV